MPSAPLIFIHYGPAHTLRTVFLAAQRSNPQRRIILLGDETNRRFVPRGVTFFPLADFRNGELLRRFEEVFVPISGRAHHFTKEGGVDVWLRFVFVRWFIIREFLHAKNIESFWIFDSDTLIAGDLGVRESRLVGLDATEQCLGGCLNGWISSRAVVDGYCEKMIEIYHRTDYLDVQRRRLEEHTGLAFNEMDAWQTHRSEVGLKTRVLGVPQEGEAFDDALAITSGWQTAATKIRNRIPVKRLARRARGGFFSFSSADSRPVQLVTLNLSWMPDYLYQRLLPGCGPVGTLEYDAECCADVDYSEPVRCRLVRLARERIWKIRSRFIRKREA